MFPLIDSWVTLLQNNIMPNSQQQAPEYAPIPPEVRAFLEDLLREANIPEILPEQKELMIEELYVRLDQFLVATIAQYMPEEKLEAFTKVVETNPDPQEIQRYLQENMPNAQDVLTVAFGKFRELYLQGVSQAAQEQEKIQNQEEKKPETKQ